MFIVVIGIIFYVMAFLLFMLTYMFPIFRMVYLDWIAMGIMIIPWVITLYRIYITKSWLQVDKQPIRKHLINYIRRDNEVIPVLGERAYPGESFIDVPNLGLIEFLGKDCVFHMGDKKIVWGLENINFTPDPRYFNLTHLFYEIGFRDTNDIINVLNGDDLELMGKVYINMMGYDEEHGVNRLITELKEYSGDVAKFEPLPEKNHRDIINKLDRIHIRKKEK